MSVGGGWNAVRGDFEGSDMFEKYACLNHQFRSLKDGKEDDVPGYMDGCRVLSPCGIHLINVVSCIPLKKRICSLFPN